MILDQWFESEWSLRLSESLLHTLWQVAIIVAFVWGLEWFVRRRSAQLVYAINVVGLMVALCMAPLTFGILGSTRTSQTRTSVVATSTNLPSPSPELGSAPGKLPENVTVVHRVPEMASPHDVASSPVRSQAKEASGYWRLLSTCGLAVYASGLCLMLFRLVWSAWRVNRVRDDALKLDEGPMVDLLKRLTDTMGMRFSPTLAIVERRLMPKVIGVTRPMILMPASALSGLTSAELELIVMHELAHVRRHDMWFLMMQRIAEAVLFFNPFLWILSRRVSLLREYACDEVACRSFDCSVNSSRDVRVEYAMALVNMARLFLGERSSETLTALAAGGRSHSELRRRIARLLGEPRNELPAMSRQSLVCLVAGLIFFAVGPFAILTSAQSITSSPPAVGESKRAEGAEVLDQATSEPLEASAEEPNVTAVDEASKRKADKKKANEPEYPSAMTLRSPLREMNQSLLWFVSGKHTHFVLYCDGFIQTGLSYSSYGDDMSAPMRWKFGGRVNMLPIKEHEDDYGVGADGNAKTKQSVRLSFINKDEKLTLAWNEKPYRLENGRVFVLGWDGALHQLALSPPPVGDTEKANQFGRRIRSIMRRKSLRAEQMGANPHPIQWGEPKSGLRLGIRPAMKMRKPDSVRAGEALSYEVWLRNETDQVIHVPRDPRELVGPAIQGERINLVRMRAFASYGLSTEDLLRSTLTIAPGDQGTYTMAYSADAVVRPKAEEDVPGAYRALFLDPGVREVIAKTNVGFVAGGVYGNDRRDHKSVSLESGVMKVTIREQSPLRVLDASDFELYAKNRSMRSGYSLLDWRSPDDPKKRLVVNAFRDDMLGVDDIASFGMVNQVDGYAIYMELTEKADKRFGDLLRGMSGRKPKPVMAIVARGKTLGVSPWVRKLPARRLVVADKQLEADARELLTKLNALLPKQ